MAHRCREWARPPHQELCTLLIFGGDWVILSGTPATAASKVRYDMARLRFGPSIKKARVRLGITQEELAKKLNVTQAAISQWELEKTFPSEDQKARVRQILGQIDAESSVSEPEEAVVSPSAIGAWLNKHRLATNLSVPELATKSGLSPVAIYNIESGQSQNPQKTTVDKLEKLLV